jgi:hypothetical protein
LELQAAQYLFWLWQVMGPTVPLVPALVLQEYSPTLACNFSNFLSVSCAQVRGYIFYECRLNQPWACGDDGAVI